MNKVLRKSWYTEDLGQKKGIVHQTTTGTQFSIQKFCQGIFSTHFYEQPNFEVVLAYIFVHKSNRGFDRKDILFHLKETHRYEVA